ncbi:flavohemoglobin expression-modulating QEGLA motif protein [Agaribacterium sp. ZY112]|uniref:flavohemoglobin expression-modulating QEGLA motif protein n=1 Tax=Agaribacterium sp. ZY112 TaxID=3233574 RepID=UPI003523CBEF
MQKLSEKQIIAKIYAGELFECELEDGSVEIKIDAYVPAICTAIHAGGKLRPLLRSLCLLSDEERRCEEDTYAESFIQAMPVTLITRDSRYEYDLNRPLAKCIHSKTWNKNLSKKERGKSIDKHQCFYRILDALVGEVERRFGSALVFDVHAYNHLNIDRSTPVFNIGTEQVDTERWFSLIDRLLSQLNKINLQNLPVEARCNNVFYGRGYMVSHINSRFANTLVLPIEIKKIYMDELKGELYPLVLRSLSEQFKGVLTDISSLFARRYTSKRKTAKASMLSEQLDPLILKVDRALFSLAKGLETLHYINPINIQIEKRSFLKSNGRYEPVFKYRPLELDPFLFRKSLYDIPVDSIRDPSIQRLYRSVIDGLSEKIGMLVNAGKPGFLYESLKYYGEPTPTDEDNAQFLLHAKDIAFKKEGLVSDSELKQRFIDEANKYGMKCKVEFSSKLVASAMVSNARRAVMISKGLSMPEIEVRALVEHELGVHMATTLNSNAQRLKVFSLGLPGNTLTQEGLAILNEYHSGNMTLGRLKTLALRVVAVKQMLKYGSFKHTYAYLHEEEGMPVDKAFGLSLRVHRGGGFTKDYLYLNGVSRALSLHKHCDIRNLYVGKTGFDFLPVINEMVERQLVEAPKYYPVYLDKPAETLPVLEYLMGSIQDGHRSTVLENFAI